MESAPETVVRKVLLSQHRGATAVVTAEAQVPMMATTLSTSMSFRAARTPASGLVWSSSLTSSTRRPSTPPAPVSGVSVPSLMRGAWARTGKAVDATRAAAPPRTARREMREGVVIMNNLRGDSSTEKDALHIGIAGQLRRGPGQAVAAVDENIPSMSEPERLARVLLHHGDGHPLRVDGGDGLEELPGGARGEAGRRLVEEQHGRLHHEGHGHGQHLALAAGERARGLSPLLGEDGETREDPLDPRPALARLEESAHLEVLAHRHARKDVLLLRHEGEAEGGDGAWRSPPDGFPAQPHRAVVRGEQARDHLEERRFARAVGTDHADDLARLEGEIHALEDFVGGAVARDHALHHEERRRGQEAHWRSPM